ncbi:hypothetical protein [Nocardia lasii]|uniref:Uncharacterized protein n=1 Tax=Nocardia lasii TaxID=1616107 RepID=A0ABW1JMW5_9NOCA
MTTYTGQWTDVFGMTIDDWLCTGTVSDIPADLSWGRVRRQVVVEVNDRLPGGWGAVVEESGAITSTSPEIFEPGRLAKVASEVRVATIDSAVWMSQVGVRAS